MSRSNDNFAEWCAGWRVLESMSGPRTFVDGVRRSLLTPAMFRWWIVGISFVAVNIALLYLLVDGFGISVLIATLVAAEIGTLLRFLANDRWVFSRGKPTWSRLWQYHVANAASFGIWWLATNAFTYLGVHYLLASVLAMGCSILLSLFTNFLWIWRHRERSRENQSAQR